MKENTPQKNTSEEMDLGQLFSLFGNWFNQLFKFISKLLNGIFNLTIQFILFLRKYIIRFAIAAMIGIGIGFFLDQKQEVIYEASLVIQPNYGSTQQLYKNIQYYNNLIYQGDTVLLASIFKITPQEAAAIRAFVIKPVGNENSTLEVYNRFLKQVVDSVTIENYDYQEFKKNIADYDYGIHTIWVQSIKNNLFIKLQPEIVEPIKENSYFDTRRKVTLDNLKRNDSLLGNSLIDIDALRDVYMEVLLIEAKRKSSQTGTTIMLSDKNIIKTNELLELFNTKMNVKNQLNENEVQRVENLEVMNVISNFPPVGSRVNIFYEKYVFILGITGVGIMFLYLILKELNAFLNAYQRKNQA